VNSSTQITPRCDRDDQRQDHGYHSRHGDVGQHLYRDVQRALDLSIDGLYVTQQRRTTRPDRALVKDRSAWVRVFVIANQANTATPQVKVDFTTGGTTHTLTINAGSSSVPLSADPANAAASWNAAVPAAWMQPSTQVVATVDPPTRLRKRTKRTTPSRRAWMCAT